MDSNRNRFLDAGDEEEDASEDLDLDLGEDSRIARISGPSRKRRKLSHSGSEESDNDAANNDRGSPRSNKTTADVEDGEDFNDGQKPRPPPTQFQSSKKPSNPKLKPLSAAQLAASQRAARNTGVIYLSRVPPFMKPSTLRNLLEPYGTVLRIFLTPEEHRTYLRRKRAGGNAKRAFVDGWIEFASKRRARACAETLNGNTIGGKKGGYYRDDVWNLKYLKGFKWDDLMEQVQGERRAREGRLRAEIQRETRERKAFMGNVEAAKRERGMEAKRKKRDGELEVEDGDREQGAIQDPSGLEMSAAGHGKHRSEMRFRQNEVKTKRVLDQKQQQDDVQRVLSKIF